MSPVAAQALGALLAAESAKLETVTVNRARRYKVGDRLLPSVTNAIGVLDKPALVHWSGDVQRTHDLDCFVALAKDLNGTLPHGEALRQIALDRIGTKLACYIKRDAAGETGTKTHALIEYELKKRLGYAGLEEPDASDEAALWAFLHFEAWAKTVDLVPIAMECAVWSDHGFAGRFDLLATVNGALSILDWKTGKDIYAEAHLQNAAYRMAVNEGLARCGVDPARRVTQGHIVLLPKQVDSATTWKVATIEDDAPAQRAFLAALETWSAMDAMKKAGVK